MDLPLIEDGINAVSLRKKSPLTFGAILSTRTTELHTPQMGWKMLQPSFSWTN